MFDEFLTEYGKKLTKKEFYDEMMEEWKKNDKEIYEKYIKPLKKEEKKK